MSGMDKWLSKSHRKTKMLSPMDLAQGEEIIADAVRLSTFRKMAPLIPAAAAASLTALGFTQIPYDQAPLVHAIGYGLTAALAGALFPLWKMKVVAMDKRVREFERRTHLVGDLFAEHRITATDEETLRLVNFCRGFAKDRAFTYSEIQKYIKYLDNGLEVERRQHARHTPDLDRDLDREPSDLAYTEGFGPPAQPPRQETHSTAEQETLKPGVDGMEKENRDTTTHRRKPELVRDIAAFKIEPPSEEKLKTGFRLRRVSGEPVRQVEVAQTNDWDNLEPPDPDALELELEDLQAVATLPKQTPGPESDEELLQLDLNLGKEKGFPEQPPSPGNADLNPLRISTEALTDETPAKPPCSKSASANSRSSTSRYLLLGGLLAGGVVYALLQYSGQQPEDATPALSGETTKHELTVDTTTDQAPADTPQDEAAFIEDVEALTAFTEASDPARGGESFDVLPENSNSLDETETHNSWGSAAEALPVIQVAAAQDDEFVMPAPPLVESDHPLEAPFKLEVGKAIKDKENLLNADWYDDRSGYTLQVVALNTLVAVQEYAEKHAGLGWPLATYASEGRRGVKHALTVNHYDDYSTAKAAAALMTKEYGIKPWVRNLKAISKERVR